MVVDKLHRGTVRSRQVKVIRIRAQGHNRWIAKSTRLDDERQQLARDGMPVCWIQIEIIRADEQVAWIRRLEYRYSARLERSYGVVDHVHHVSKRKMFQHMER